MPRIWRKLKQIDAIGNQFGDEIPERKIVQQTLEQKYFNCTFFRGIHS
jgi:hypothetical protein